MSDRKQHVLLTAKQLFIHKGFFATTVQDILTEANISKGTFYNYFSTKNECLIAILRHLDEKIFIKRQELLLGEDITCQRILSQQILIRFQMNHEQNLLPIFQDIFHSKDPELKCFIDKHHVKEIQWLAERCIDIYGEDARHSSFNAAILLLGLVHQLFHMLKISSAAHINAADIIDFVMRRMDVIMDDLKQTNDILFQQEMFARLITDNDSNTYTKEQVNQKLKQLLQSTEKVISTNCKEHINFIMEEMNTEKPRIFILRSVLCALRKLLLDTPYGQDFEDVIAQVWRYVESLE